jgi:hypothetical protein
MSHVDDNALFRTRLKDAKLDTQVKYVRRTM